MPGVTTAYQNGVHGSRPAATSGCILYACSTHSLIYRSDGTTWTTWMTIGSSTTTVASDAIWDVAGDLAVGTGADTAARLPIGAAGGALSVINGGAAWNSGTSFPASKLTGDRYWRTDLGMEAYWDGTRWVTTEVFHCTLAYASTLTPATVGGSTYRGVLYGSTYDQYLIEMRTAVHAATTNNGSNYWTATLADQAGGAIGGGVSFNTSADAVDTWVYKTTAIGVVLSGKIEIQATLTATGSPGSIYFVPIVAYRLVLT